MSDYTISLDGKSISLSHDAAHALLDLDKNIGLVEMQNSSFPMARKIGMAVEKLKAVVGE
ncbi:hypothetical protein V7O66_03320 [Methanolobus sp. ZRKC3]|uniref:hypothetical protein n=1 Tax=Methanolobus sp. ZRKC3 TaxID=3125786 RepID=UPI00325527B3